jgi:hypothetical protein
LVEKKACLSILAIASVNDAEKVVQVHKRHIRVDIFDVSLQWGILKRENRYRQGALDLQVVDILCCNLGRERAQESRKLGGGGSLLPKRAERLGDAEIIEDRRAGHEIGPE